MKGRSSSKDENIAAAYRLAIALFRAGDPAGILPLVTALPSAQQPGSIRLVPATLDQPPGLDAFLREIGEGENGFSGEERGKGYGRRILAGTLALARALGLEQVLVVAYAGNTASLRVIEANRGVLEDERKMADGHLYRRYWIGLA